VLPDSVHLLVSVHGSENTLMKEKKNENRQMKWNIGQIQNTQRNSQGWNESNCNHARQDSNDRRLELQKAVIAVHDCML
jgi:hypothetical protein